MKYQRVFETHCFNKLDFTPVAYFRYVDDIFAIIPKNKLSQMVNVFNSYNDRLKFTYELENDNSISFLDLLIRENGKIITNCYQKPTFSSRLMSFNSKHCLNKLSPTTYSESSNKSNTKSQLFLKLPFCD